MIGTIKFNLIYLNFLDFEFRIFLDIFAYYSSDLKINNF